METKLCHPETLRTGRGSGEMTSSQTAEVPSLGCETGSKTNAPFSIATTQ